jgi:ABC-type phosphate transport system substrate-binding protein
LKPNSSVFKLGDKRLKLVVLLIILIKQVSAAPSPDNYAANAVYAVINADTAQHIISKNKLGAIFKMRLRHWQDGSPITVFVLEDENPLHRLFCKKILNVFPHQMRKSWNKLVFSGTGQAPVQVTDQQDMIDKISSTPGAIGYLSGENINDKIRVLQID